MILINIKIKMSSNATKESIKKSLVDALHQNGTVNLLKSKVKSQLVSLMNEKNKNVKRNMDFELLTPFQKVSKSKELMLLTHLMLEFMQFYELDYTIPVFKGETNLNEVISKETLIKDSNLRNSYDNQSPILLQILNSFLNDKSSNKKFNEEIYKKDKEYSYSGLGLLSSFGNQNNKEKEKESPISNIDLSNISKNKKLSPLSFNENKEVKSKGESFY